MLQVREGTSGAINRTATAARPAFLGLSICFFIILILATGSPQEAVSAEYHPLPALAIDSPTHPSEDDWYPGTDATFRWSQPLDPGNTYDPPCEVRDAYAYGGYLYLATVCGIRILDISDPENPIETGSIGSAVSSAIEVHGDFAYVATSAGTGGLTVIDVSDPAHPFFAGFIDTPGTANDVTVAGGYAYVADGGGGLAVIDISNPAAPASVSSYGTITDAYRVDVSGGLACVPEANGALQIIDVTDPAHPYEAARMLSDSFLDAAVSGSHAFILKRDRLQIFDISNAASPSLAGEFPLSSAAGRVELDGGVAYVMSTDFFYGSVPADGWYTVNKLNKLDVTDPADPFLAASYSKWDGPTGWPKTGFPYLALASGRAYMPDIKSTTITAVTYDMRTLPVDTLPVSYVLDQDPGTVPDAVPETAGSQASFSGLASGEYYFHAAAVRGSNTGPVSHRRIRVEGACGNQPDLGISSHGAFWDSYADYLERRLSVDFTIANRGAAGARVIDVTGLDASAGVGLCNGDTCENPLELAGTAAVPDIASGVVAEGQYAYVAVSHMGLVIYDVSDPSRPVEAGRYEGLSYVTSLGMYCHYAYVGAYLGIYVIDVSDPAAPVLAGHFEGRSPRSIAFRGNRAYTLDDDGISIFDITDPANPVKTGGVALISTDDITISGDRAYVAGYQSLRIFELTNPDAPALTGTYSFPAYSEARSVAIRDNLAYVTTENDINSQYRLDMIDVSDPAAPFAVSSATTPYYPYDVAVDGGYAYVADTGDGIIVFDVSDPAAPFIAGSQDTPGNAGKVSISAGHIYLADYYGGLRIYTGARGTPNFPIGLGDLMPGEQRGFTASFRIPAGVERFRLGVRATATDMCGNRFSYGG